MVPQSTAKQVIEWLAKRWFFAGVKRETSKDMEHLDAVALKMYRSVAAYVDCDFKTLSVSSGIHLMGHRKKKEASKNSSAVYL